MRHYSMPEREAIAKLRPKSSNDRQRLVRMGVFVSLVVVLVGSSIYLNHRNRQSIEATWQSSVATIQDVRFQPAVQIESNRGGAMLYDVQVLAHYSADGTTHDRWIIVQQQPRGIAEAKLQVVRWKGQKCFVRWKASNPDQVIADVS